MWSEYSWILLMSVRAGDGACHAEAVRGFQSLDQCIAAAMPIAGLLDHVKDASTDWRLDFTCVAAELREPL